MNCTACCAPIAADRSYCAVCGRMVAEGNANLWDREPEALLYQSLQSILAQDEPLLAASRGRISGSWRTRAQFSHFTFIAPYANLGMTGNRLVIQQVHPKTGEAVGTSESELPLNAIASIQASDADPFEPGTTARLTVVRNDGESFRLRAVGRLAHAAHELAEVWKTLSDSSNPEITAEFSCDKCNRGAGRPYRFCPFCGAEQGAS